MTCHCQQLKPIVDVETLPNDFDKSLKIITNGEWRDLKQCKQCKQPWRVDVWDKLQTQFAVKLESGKDWESLDTADLQKEHLLYARGGIDQDTKCIWAGCNLPTVKNVVYCINHLYETGARD